MRHASFDCEEFVALAREHQVAIVEAGDSEYPRIEARTAPFSYLRVMGTKASAPKGYAPAALARWRERAQTLARDGDVFLYFISGAKERNPQAARALLAALSCVESAGERRSALLTHVPAEVVEDGLPTRALHFRRIFVLRVECLLYQHADFTRDEFDVDLAAVAHPKVDDLVGELVERPRLKSTLRRAETGLDIGWADISTEVVQSALN